MIAETMAIVVNRRYLKLCELPGINSDEPQSRAYTFALDDQSNY
jgi:hypothetical protein